jgi:hypothetical protein
MIRPFFSGGGAHVMNEYAQFGPRSTGHEGIPQPTLLSMRIGRLYPSTRETGRSEEGQVAAENQVADIPS